MLELKGVHKIYREGSVEVHALKDVDMTVQAERFTMVVGPSGSGKSTLLNLIGGIDAPTSGTVTIDGRDLYAMPDAELTAFRASRVAFVFQNFNLLPVLSALENVEYALTMAGVAQREARSRAREFLVAVGLERCTTHRPNQLSGGQRQRVAIARALAKRPALVLADEPTANLDSATAAGIVQLMRDMQRQCRTTFLFSTHDPELMQHADEILVTRDGSVSSSRSLGPLGNAA